MARLFDDASSELLYNASAVLTTYPLSMACWFSTDVLTITETLMSITSNSQNPGSDGFTMDISGTEAGDPIRVGQEWVGTNYKAAKTTAGPSANTWAHACGVWAAVNDLRAFLNGGSKGTNTTGTSAPTTRNTTYIGGFYWGGALRNYFSGMIAEAAIWNIDLSDGDAATLALGVSPLKVKPDYLVAYWPLIGRVSPEIDIIGRYEMTLSGTNPAAHPRLLRPGSPIQVQYI